ncbi:predicted protein [Naegleria gruberi]|uniref:Predicted protein n=1 Tax=Naegleria gruberi TaxID=5762 RepID=D2V725_NAEGR|nr:uncharacterized protein NAEGRDRAFT_47183 [Naegleria gruberi]EFC47296.1 predicted protein [Naegleria gruberi]|eukprot:XP_002680040.1 predicted protein [Naegleria gruberi strain NEG-M]
MADLTELERDIMAEWDSPATTNENNNTMEQSSSEDNTNSESDSTNPEKKKRKIDHLNVDTTNENGNNLEPSLDLPTTPSTTPTLPSVEEHEPKEEYVKKEEYDKLIKVHTETITKLTHEFKLVTEEFKKEM